MGNCLTSRQSRMDSDDDDDWWQFDKPEASGKMAYGGREGGMEKQREAASTTEVERLLGEKEMDDSGDFREVKIKITKRQLEELLGRSDVGGVSIEDMLVELMTLNPSSIDESKLMHRTWRPVLQSIPEMN